MREGKHSRFSYRAHDAMLGLKHDERACTRCIVIPFEIRYNRDIDIGKRGRMLSL